jgi:hypothetical protein
MTICEESAPAMVALGFAGRLLLAGHWPGSKLTHAVLAHPPLYPTTDYPALMWTMICFDPKRGR